MKSEYGLFMRKIRDKDRRIINRAVQRGADRDVGKQYLCLQSQASLNHQQFLQPPLADRDVF